MSKALIAVALVAALCAAAIYQAGALGALWWAMGKTKCCGFLKLLSNIITRDRTSTIQCDQCIMLSIGSCQRRQ